MFNKTPITVVPPGYKPDLDRLPPQQAGGCKGCLWIFVLILLIAGIGVGVVFALAPKSESIPTIIPTRITEIIPSATATLDYCWFLTPTNEPLPTIEVTLDQWQLKATDDAFQTGTPTVTPLATVVPPRAWCNETPVVDATATFTPFQIPSDVPILEFVPTETITNTPVPTHTAIPTAVPTSTLFPTLVPRDNPVNIQQPATQPETIIVVRTVVVVEETVKIITATPQPTSTLLPTIALEETEEPTLLPTFTATDVPMITATLIPTVTASSTLNPTSTFTPTSTVTNTFTPTATATFTATLTATATLTHTPTATSTYTASPFPTSTLFPTLETPANE